MASTWSIRSVALAALASFSWGYSTAYHSLTDILDVLFAPVAWLFSPGPGVALELHGIIRAVVADPIGTLRRNLPFRAFAARARDHADFNGSGFTQAHRSVVPI